MRRSRQGCDSSAETRKKSRAVSFVGACEGRQRKAECEAGQNFIRVTAVGQGMPQPNIEAEFVIDLPYRADEARYGVRCAELVLVEDLRDRPHFPLRWPFDYRS